MCLDTQRGRLYVTDNESNTSIMNKVVLFINISDTHKAMHAYAFYHVNGTVK